ncbi:MAG: DUF429 domain-containing protein, partial [Phycisphaerae bacterium]|nr:DUF429 domain-containing protein [Phycisphaerae bacterium]
MHQSPPAASPREPASASPPPPVDAPARPQIKPPATLPKPAAKKRLSARSNSRHKPPNLPHRNKSTTKSVRSEQHCRNKPAQAFGIYAKIRELDTLLQADEDLRRRVKEIHPEVSFWAWYNKTPMPHPKRTKEGQAERRSLILQIIPEEILARIRAAYPR